MADYESAPPEGLWEAVESGLARKRAAAFPWRWALTGAGFAAAATAVAALVLLVWTPGGKSGPGLVAVAPDKAAVVEETVVPEETVAQDEAVVPEETPAARTLLADAAPATAEAQPVAEDLPVEEKQPVADDIPVADEIPVVADEVPSADTVPPADAVSPADEKPEEAPSGVSTFPGPQTRPSDPAAPARRSESSEHRKRTRVSQGRRLSGSLIAGNVAGGPVSSTFTEIGMPAMFNLSTKAGGSMPDAATLARNRETENTVSHSVSGSFGLMLNFSITDQWAVEGGIQRTVLYSTGVSQTEAASSRMTRTTVYAGYPVMAVFTPWRGKHLSAYASAGPMLEHATRSRWTSESVLGTYDTGRKSGTDNIDEWIASMGVAAGVQWDFDGWGALFLQPGFRWRFPGEDSIDSFYKERPRSFNLSAGFRVWF